MERIEISSNRLFAGGPSPIANMNFNDLIPTYENGNLVGWTCSRCAWSHTRDIHLADIDALAIARAEFFNHTCGLSEVGPGCGKAHARRSYLLLSKVCGFEAGGVLVVDSQTIGEYGTEDEVEKAFHDFSLAHFAEECEGKLGPTETVVFVSKVVSECDEAGNTREITRDDLKFLDSL
jgi:hypothetical protein